MDPVWVTGLKFVTWCRFFFDTVFYGVVCEFLYGSLISQFDALSAATPYLQVVL